MALLLLTTGVHGQNIKADRAAPQIDLQSLDGRRVRLSDYRGHPVVLVFWATWCGHCRGEFRELTKAHKEFSATGLRVLAVNGRDQEDRTGDVERFSRETGAQFDVVLDRRGKFRRAYGLKALPTTIFIDSAGIIKRVNLGAISPDDLQAGIALIR